ncbi:MAG: leucine-rich repeat domain-containing protein [Treponema sp.]|nr:leucine-rich repeat domain-containing protein [Treponema sp.]
MESDKISGKINEKIKGLAFRGMLEKRVSPETRARFPILDKLIPLTNYIASGLALVVVAATVGAASNAVGGGRVNAGTSAPPATNLGDFTTDGYHSITGYTGFDTDLNIPAQIGSRNTRFITADALRDYALTSVNIPVPGVRILGNAFRDNRLTSLTIPPRAIVEDDAFRNNQISNLVIGDGAIITSDAFRYNPISSITVGNGVHMLGRILTSGNNLSIGNGGSINDYEFNAFLSGAANRQRQITLGDKIGVDKTLNFEGGYYSVYFDYFANDRRAGTYEIPVVGYYPRQREGDFQFVATPYGAIITEISAGRAVSIPGVLGGLPVKGVFDGGSINRIQFPQGLTFIHSQAFRWAPIGELTLPSSLSFIGANAFEFNPELRSLAIPAAVTFIGSEAFTRNEQLSTLTIPNNSALEYIGASAFSRSSISTPLTLPAGLTFLGDNAFAENNIPSVTLPAGLTYMGNGVFKNNNLTSVTLPSDLLYIGQEVFSDNNLSTVRLPSGIEFIGGGAFSGNNITDLTIPPSLVYTGRMSYRYENHPNQFEVLAAFDHSSFYYAEKIQYSTAYSARNPLDRVTTLNLPANLPDSALGFPKVVVELYIQNNRRAATFEYRRHPIRSEYEPQPFIDDTYRPDSGWQLLR